MGIPTLKCWHFDDQIQITRSSYHKYQILKCQWEWFPSLNPTLWNIGILHYKQAKLHKHLQQSVNVCHNRRNGFSSVVILVQNWQIKRDARKDVVETHHDNVCSHRRLPRRESFGHYRTSIPKQRIPRPHISEFELPLDEFFY